jgi:hypothetical protein
MLAATCAVAILGLSALSLTQQSEARPGRTPANTTPAPAGVQWTKAHQLAHFHTNVGSFKLLGVNEEPAEGVLEMSFKGTVLVSNLEPGGTVQVTGDVRKEIDDPSLRRQVYFGDGSIKIVGKMRAVQFFGRNLNAQYKGFGFLRLYGEFDRDLNTGYYWYEGDEEKMPWGTHGAQMPVPKPDFAPAPARVRVRGGGGE